MIGVDEVQGSGVQETEIAGFGIVNLVVLDGQSIDGVLVFIAFLFNGDRVGEGVIKLVLALLNNAALVGTCAVRVKHKMIGGTLIHPVVVRPITDQLILQFRYRSFIVFLFLFALAAGGKGEKQGRSEKQGEYFFS